MNERTHHHSIKTIASPINQTDQSVPVMVSWLTENTRPARNMMSMPVTLCTWKRRLAIRSRFHLAIAGFEDLLAGDGGSTLDGFGDGGSADATADAEGGAGGAGRASDAAWSFCGLALLGFSFFDYVVHTDIDKTFDT